ncbi:hypothetical protein PoB_003806900 [Plakobranchus ocellatus]|uniref:Uncharacterized protein n=1 Tax=Plakobranchus ocellatus TaxID=259542 RepID=A0AAV4AZQ2_9GAST|nr:hypothetical protein PoB_003806900 [Plakobranchus ocellatus]
MISFRDQSHLRSTCPMTTIMQNEKAVGRKEGGGRVILTELDRSRRTRIVTNRRRGANLYVRAQMVRTQKEGGEKLDCLTNREPV